MPIKRVLIAAGGTGGHLYPAQALAQQLKMQPVPCDVLFVAGGLSGSRYFDRAQFSFNDVVCSPLLSRNPLKAFAGLKNLVKGTRQSIAILKKFKPDVVVGFGSYYTVPTLLAARWLKVPIILHEANSIPGKANQWLAAFADTIALHFPSAAAFFKTKTVEVGLPLREGYRLGAVEKGKALAYYQLMPGRRTLLVCGGSQGAQSINRLMQECIPALKNLGVQVIHLTGDQKAADALASIYAAGQIPAAVKPFESQMHMAWSAADAFLGRSGASTVAESVEFEVPGILVPYPYATDNHQEKNADFLIEAVGSAWKLLESELVPGKLEGVLDRFFQEGQIHAFKNALKAYKHRPNQMTLCELVMEHMHAGNRREASI